MNIFNLYGKIKVNQKKYKIPLLGKIGIHHLFGWEPWLDYLLKKITQFETGLFVDVGANIGQTLLKINSISPTMQYIGFEPNPTCIHYLDILIKKNNILNAVIFPIGVSHKNAIEELTLYKNIECDAAASIVPRFRPTNKTYGKKHVPTFNIQTIKESFEFKNISILKIDVEGMENVVLKEFKHEIIKHKPIILIEILPVYSMANKDRYLRQQMIEELVIELNYVMYKLKLDKGVLKGFNKIDKIGIHSDIDACEYVFVHKTKISKFETYCQQSA